MPAITCKKKWDCEILIARYPKGYSDAVDCNIKLVIKRKKLVVWFQFLEILAFYKE